MLVYALGLVHALGAGTDAGSLWLRAVMLVPALPAVGLFALRTIRGRRAPARAVRPRPPAQRRPLPRRAAHESQVIVGGGLAGQRCCETLRALGDDGPITLLCAEAERALRPAPALQGRAGWRQRPAGRGRRPGTPSTRSSCASRARRGASTPPRAGSSWRGARSALHAAADRDRRAPATLPALAGRANARVLRTFDDALALCAALRPGVRLVVVGAGLIGHGRPGGRRAGDAARRREGAV